MRTASSRGTVLIETLFVLPTLLVILFGAIEFGSFFNQYLVLTQIAREGARDASKRPGLEIMAVGDPKDPKCDCAVHAEVHARIHTLLVALEKQKVLRATADAVSLISSRSKNGQTVSLKLEMPNNSLIGSLFGLTIRQESVVRYLVDYSLLKAEIANPIKK